MIGRATPQRRQSKDSGHILRWLLPALPLAIVAAVAARSRPAASSLGSRPPWRPWLPLVTAIDHKIGWDRLPWPIALAMIVTFLRHLRRDNLYDTSTLAPPPAPTPRSPVGTSHLTTRTADGAFNNLAYPEMGTAGTRFGRNVPPTRAIRESDASILTPNPRTVSRELLTRHQFQPAETLNVLAAAWIQFMIRDWFSHGPGDTAAPRWDLPLTDGDPWPREQRPMTILRTLADPARPPRPGESPTFLNAETQWWDASQIYGNDIGYQQRVRSGSEGKLRVDSNGMPDIPQDPLSPKHPADVPGFWIGLAMLHTLFTLEHNAICDRFRAEYPAWSDEEIFQHARLVNAALMAKIHTVEWTPAIINNPATRRALRGDWWGLQGERLNRLFGRFSDHELISGTVGAPTRLFGVPYALTEEFVAVYRMHPLIPDDYVFRSSANHRQILERDFAGVAQRQALDVAAQVPIDDLFYSFGVAHPGALSLHNFPRGLQNYQRPDGRMQDLAATDILRTRELGVPRYTAFRELFHLRPIRSFEQLTPNREWSAQLREVYDGDIDGLDLMIGMFAEPKPPGFGFSDTAFRVFVLMATRRLTSDRFFTSDFNPRVYTRLGLDWIADNDMSSVILRHFPSLRPALRATDNAFMPWSPAA